MASLYELNAKKNQYANLKNGVNDIINSLNNNIEILDVPSSNIGLYYKVDGQSAYQNAIYTEMKKLIDKRDYLNNTVIPAINDNINNINADIKKEEERLERERLEKERRERERRERERLESERLEEERKKNKKTSR